MDHTTSPADDARAIMLITQRLTDPQVQQFFTGNRHKQAATRALLEVLGVPLPSWMQRSPSGRAAQHRAAVDRFLADNPQGPATVAPAQAATVSARDPLEIY